jgi:hypothetical protein
VARNLWDKILADLPTDWQDVATCLEALARSAETAFRLTGHPTHDADRWPCYWILHIWQSSKGRIELGGHVGGPDAPFKQIDWAMKERGPLACSYDERRNRLRHVDTGQIVFGLKMRRVPVAPIITPAPSQPTGNTLAIIAPGRETKAEHDATDDKILDQLIGKKQAQEPPDDPTAQPSDYSQAKQHAPALPVLGGTGKSESSRQNRFVRALRRRRERNKHSSR